MGRVSLLPVKTLQVARALWRDKIPAADVSRRSPPLPQIQKHLLNDRKIVLSQRNYNKAPPKKANM